MPANFFWQLGAWGRFYLQARSWRRTHPPHLFHLFEAMQQPVHHVDVEALKSRWRQDPTPLTAADAGAGSRRKGARTVGNVARTALKSAAEAGRLAQMARGLNARQVLELGTCLGATTAVIARTGAQVTTIEADPTLAARADEGWRQLGVRERIDGQVGTFADRLDELEPEWRAAEHPGFGLIFIDGHHQGDALKSYVERLRPWLAKGRVAAIVCDDIRWSPGMWEAWERLAEGWPVAVDLGGMGLLMDGPRLTPFHRAVRL